MSLINRNIITDLSFRLYMMRNISIFPFLILRDIFAVLGLKLLFQNKRFLVKIQGYGKQKNMRWCD